MFQADCDFCKIATRNEFARVVMRTDLVVAFFPTEPATLGHTLVVPVNHVPDIWALDRDAAAVLAPAVLKVAHAVKAALSPDGLNIIQSNGEAATQTIKHLHIHVVPRWVDDAMGQIWPAESKWPEQRKDEALSAIRKAMGEDT
jgi:histidine triad (HIT) family protein